MDQAARSATAPTDDQDLDLGAALRVRRRDLGLTQAELAELAGVSTRFIGALERGKASVRLDHLLAVSDALGLRIRAVPQW